MTSFTNIKTPEEIKYYLLNVLSRTGGKTKDQVYLYHYTSINALAEILVSNSIWLGSTRKMNDYMEGEFIESSEGKNKVFFACFSRAEENIAMYKMYAPPPNGAMLVISYSMAQAIIDNLPVSDNKTVCNIVRDNKITSERVPADIYWSAVAYKALHSDLLKCETVKNEKIENPLFVRDLAGFVKLYGWEYEREVRLSAVTEKILSENEKIALPLPTVVTKNAMIVTSPGFDKQKYKKTISKLKRLGVTIHDSEYDGLADISNGNIITGAD